MRHRSLVRSFEWIACACFGYLIVACWLTRLSIGRRAFLIAASAIAAGIVVLIARAGSLAGGRLHGDRHASAAGLVLAAGICVACVVGRYHYAVDVAAGAGVALLLWLVN